MGAAALWGDDFSIEKQLYYKRYRKEDADTETEKEWAGQIYCPVCGEALSDDEKIYCDASDTVLGCEKCLTACWAEVLLNNG